MDTYDATTSGQIDVSSERSLGLVGAILTLLALIPKVGKLLGLIGFVLILIALHGIGEKTGNKRPFNYYLKSFIIVLAVVIVFVLLVIAAFATMAHTSSDSSSGEIISHLDSSNPVQVVSYGDHEELTTAGKGMVVVAFILLISAAILGAYYEKRTWEEMARLTKVKEFNDAAKFLWWGALTIVILVGVVLLLIAAIYKILAFSNMPQRLNLGAAAPRPAEQFDVDEFEGW